MEIWQTWQHTQNYTFSDLLGELPLVLRCLRPALLRRGSAPHGHPAGGEMLQPLRNSLCCPADTQDKSAQENSASSTKQDIVLVLFYIILAEETKWRRAIKSDHSSVMSSQICVKPPTSPYLDKTYINCIWNFLNPVIPVTIQLYWCAYQDMGSSSCIKRWIWGLV